MGWRERMKAARTAATAAAVKAAVKAAISVDDLRMAFYNDIAIGDRYWWWIREVRLMPSELIVDDDQGELYRIEFTVNDDETVTFQPPVEVEIQYVDVPPGGDPDDASDIEEGPITVAASAPTQVELARYGDRLTAGAHTKASASSGGASTAGSPAVRVPLSRAAVAATVTPADGTTTPTLGGDDPAEPEVDVKLTAEQLAKLGLPDDASEDQISEAIAKLIPDTPADAATPEADEPAAPAAAPTPELPEGMSLVDTETLNELTSVAASYRKREGDEAKAARTRAVDEAIKAGKLAPARRDHYLERMDIDPDGTAAFLASAAPIIPVAERGYQGGDNATGAAESAYPTAWRKTVEASQRQVAQSRRVRVMGD